MKQLYILFAAIAVTGQAYAANITMTMNYESTNRNFIVHLPAGYTAGQSLPLVFNLHGYTSNAAQQQLYSGMDATADANNFIVVYPNGIGNAWNSGFINYNSSPDDVGFISKIIDTMKLLYNVNLNRVYSCGMSNGGFQSYRLACDLESRIAAIASVTGSMTATMTNNCSLSRSVPVLQIHGTADATVPYNGGGGIMSTEAVIDFWVSKNQCTATHDTINTPDVNTNDNTTVQEIRYRTCNGGSEVWLFKVIGGGHTWPGAFNIGLPTNQDINASQEIWDFFNRYTLNSATGVTEVKEEKVKVKVYPNPANDLLKIEADRYLEAVTVTNALGQIVLSAKPTAAEMQFNLSTLHQGIYFVKTEGNGFSETRRIVKQ